MYSGTQSTKDSDYTSDQLVT